MKFLTTYRSKWQKDLFLILSISVAVTLPFSVPISSLAIILLSINWLLEGHWGNKLQLLLQNKYAPLMIGFYGYHVIGLLYTSNMHDGLGDLEKKMSFVVFPLIFSTSLYLRKPLVATILNCFVASCLVAAAICLVNGIYQYMLGDSSYLFYHELASPLKLHAVYFSVYISFSIFILLNDLKSNWNGWTMLKKGSYLLVIVFFLIFLILLSSKMILVAFVVILVFFIARIVSQQKGMFWAFMIFLACLTFFSLILFLIPNTRERFKEVLKDKYEQENVLRLEDYQYYHFTGANIRLAIWKTLVEAVEKENAWIFGVGTGDTQDILTASYVEKHIYPGDQYNLGFIDYNAHNQFFQFLIALGALGLIWFLGILTFLFMKSIREHRTVLTFLLMLFSSFCLTESALCAQKGIVFFMFFASLLATDILREVDSPENKSGATTFF